MLAFEKREGFRTALIGHGSDEKGRDASVAWNHLVFWSSSAKLLWLDLSSLLLAIDPFRRATSKRKRRALPAVKDVCVFLFVYEGDLRSVQTSAVCHGADWSAGVELRAGGISSLFFCQAREILTTYYCTCVCFRPSYASKQRDKLSAKDWPDT